MLKLVNIVEPCVSACAPTEPLQTTSLTYQDPEADKHEERKDSRGDKEEPSGFLKTNQYMYCCCCISQTLTAVPQAALAHPSSG